MAEVKEKERKEWRKKIVSREESKYCQVGFKYVFFSLKIK